MNIFKMDSPFMNKLRSITDLMFLQVLFVICCIPVVTIGPAITAKYYVAMKIIKNEDSGVIKPFFKCFAYNFKQSLPIWLVHMIISFVLFIDWVWIFDNGWNSVSIIYKVGLGVVTILNTCMIMVVFPMISKFTMKTLEYFKGAIIFAGMNFFKFLLIIVLGVATVVACIWYFQWLPLIAIFMSLTLTYFLVLIFNKEFKKIEDSFVPEITENKEEREDDPDSEVYEVAGAQRYASSRKELAQIEAESKLEEESRDDPNADYGIFGKRKEVSEDIKMAMDGKGLRSGFRRTYLEEREKMQELNTKQKLAYFSDYYLAALIILIFVAIGVIWYGVDVYKGKQVVMTGGLINVEMTDEAIELATSKFIEWGQYESKKKVKLGSTDMNFNPEQELDNMSMELAFQAQVATGQFDFFIMDEAAIDRYSKLDFFADLNDIVELSSYEEDRLFYTDPEFTGTDSIPCGVKLSDETVAKLGLAKDREYYIAFSAINYSPDTYATYIEYLDNVITLG